MRAGAFGLSLLSTPLNVHVLQALKEDSRSLYDLRRAVGAPPQTTMRGNMRTLDELGIVERRRLNDFPGSIEFELTGTGRSLLEVAEILKAWLDRSPQGPLPLGSPAAKSAIKALVEGWSTAILRALAARSLSLTELSKLIAGLSYPSLERRLTAMRIAGQIEARSEGGRGTPYVVTPWLRLAIGPLIAAARWEREHIPTEVAPVGRIDVEAAFLLAIPLLRLPESLSGSCRMAVALGGSAGDTRLAGIVVEVNQGKIVSAVARLEGRTDGWVSGSTAAWLRALVDGEAGEMETGGSCDLAASLLDGLHAVLFRYPTKSEAGLSQAVAVP